MSTRIYFKFPRAGNIPVPLPGMITSSVYNLRMKAKLSVEWVASQGLRRISSGKNQFLGPDCVDINLRTPATRRDRTFGLPPAFESLVNDESDSFWSNSSGSDTLPAFADSQNVADEDTWVSLNRGSQQEFAYFADEDTWGNMNERHINADSRSSHTSSESENRRGSKQATLLAEGSSKIDMVNNELPVDSCFYFST